MSRTVLWWGRFDPDYSRNRVLRQLFRDQAWQVVDFRPRLSVLGDWQAAVRHLPDVDLVWLPCFRQRDLPAARRWSRRRGVPLIADPLISAYDKQVFERGKWVEGSPGAVRLRAREGRMLESADLLVADTPAHAEFFSHTFGIPENRIRIIYVGAEEPAFHPVPMSCRDGGGPLEVLFYGSFIGLQGAEVIVEAARLYRGPAVKWTLLGAGPLRKACEEKACGLANVVFEDWIPYTELPGRIHRADILLGIFGTTDKAARVIPNKMFQALACGRPVITRSSPAYPARLLDMPESGIVWVEAGNPARLAEAVASMASGRSSLDGLGAKAAETYRHYFSGAVISGQLRDALSTLVH